MNGRFLNANEAAVSVLFVEALESTEDLATKWTLELCLAASLLMIGPHFHALYVHTVAAAEATIGDGLLLGQKLVLANWTHVARTDWTLFKFARRRISLILLQHGVNI